MKLVLIHAWSRVPSEGDTPLITIDFVGKDEGIC